MLSFTIPDIFTKLYVYILYPYIRRIKAGGVHVKKKYKNISNLCFMVNLDSGEQWAVGRSLD